MQSSLNLALDSDHMLHAGDNITSPETGGKSYLTSERYASLLGHGVGSVPLVLMREILRIDSLWLRKRGPNRGFR